MTPRTSTLGFAARARAAGAVGAASLALALGLPAAAGAAPAGVHPAPASDPYAPGYHHPYRHGAVPTRAAAAAMSRWAARHGAAPQRTTASDLRYGGGIDGIGVTTGHEKVYLVFFGSQWGKKRTNSAGDILLSGDHVGEAPYLQQLFKGLGRNNERWSGVMTQYCQGVAAGAQRCPASAPHVAYPKGGALKGVWVDERTASPFKASGHRLAEEAIRAAAHFGNKTRTANRDAQYVILSPTGTHPDGFNTPSGVFCAWHDWNADPTLPGGPASSPYGPIAFTNMPYVTDAGGACGEDFVNPGGTRNGISIVEGHEYAETITDQVPAGGWTDAKGLETGDKCAWIPPGTPGGARDLKLATGSFAMQSTWSNDVNGCEFTHSLVTAPVHGTGVSRAQFAAVGQGRAVCPDCGRIGPGAR